MASVGTVILRLARSGVAGAAASLADLAVLTALTELAGISPRAASVPALVTGAIAMFFGQRQLAFRATGKPSAREVALFAAVQIGGLVLTGLLFDLVLRLRPELARHYVPVRLLTTNLVWLFYSFPLWHWVFRPPRTARGDIVP